MKDRRERQDVLRRRAVAIGIAASLAVHAAVFVLVRFRVDVRGAAPARAVRLLPPVDTPAEPERTPELIRLREPTTELAVGDPAPAPPEPATTPEPAPQLAGAPPALANLPATAAPAVLTLEVPTADAGPLVDGGLDADPLDVPLYRPGEVGEVKRGWLTAAGLNPRGAAVAIWVVGCPAPRTIVTTDSRPTYRGRPCH